MTATAALAINETVDGNVDGRLPPKVDLGENGLDDMVQLK